MLTSAIFCFQQHKRRLLNGRTGLSNGTTVFKSQNLARDGYGLMAAALLAIDHFNSRDVSVVQELAAIRQCTFQFPLDLLQVMDSNRSPTSTFHGLLSVRPPCVVIGPLDDDAAQVMQLALQAENILGITYGARSRKQIFCYGAGLQIKVFIY